MQRLQSDTEKQLRLKMREMSPIGLPEHTGLEYEIVALCYVMDARYSTLLEAFKLAQSTITDLDADVFKLKNQVERLQGKVNGTGGHVLDGEHP